MHVPGPRYVVQVGEKMIDFNESFRLFLSTRIPNPEIPPDAASIVTEVNFTTTRAGLTGQVGTKLIDKHLSHVNIQWHMAIFCSLPVSYQQH